MLWGDHQKVQGRCTGRTVYTHRGFMRYYALIEVRPEYAASACTPASSPTQLRIPRVRLCRQYTLPYLDVREAPVMAFDRTGSKTP